MPLTNRQLEGAITLVVIASIIYVAAYFFSLHPLRGTSIPYSDRSPVTVELTGEMDHRGLYFIPENTTVSDFLKMAKVESTNGLDKRTLSTGMTVNINANGQLSLGEMSAAKRLLLNIPIDVNQASVEDLILVPGIGEKTAQRIIHFRETSGKLQRLEDLMKIRGIKEKRFAKIKKYLYVGGN